MAAKDLIFTVKREDTGATAQLLRSAGVSVSNEMHNIGVINGTADEADVESLRSIPGVIGIETSRNVQIAPPDSPVQ